VNKKYHFIYCDFIIEKLVTEFSEQIFKFNNRFELIPKGQIPISVLVVLQGDVTMIKDNRTKLILNRGLIFGMNEISSNLPSKWSCIVEKNTELLILERMLIGPLKKILG